MSFADFTVEKSNIYISFFHIHGLWRAATQNSSPDNSIFYNHHHYACFKWRWFYSAPAERAMVIFSSLCLYTDSCPWVTPLFILSVKYSSVTQYFDLL